METASILEFIAVVARYVHVVAAIMWIGNSLLFTWMEINFIKDGKEDDDRVLGYMNMLHAGGVYYLEKRVIDPVTLPPKIHRFLWQSYTTWISGFILFMSVFYVRGSTLLANPGPNGLSNFDASLISAGSIALGWVAYDRFWRTSIKEKPLLGSLICFAVIIAYAAGLEMVFNGRAVYLQVGAMLGTIMTANVFFIIIPNQRKMMQALLEGKPHNLELGKQAKVRSMMNNYITFPVIFLMLSAHFPQTYGADRNIAIMAVILVSLVIIKHMMNIYNHFAEWLHVLLGTFVTGAIIVILLISLPTVRSGGNGSGSSPTSVSAAALSDEAQAGERVFNRKGCQACHLPSPSTIAPMLHGLYLQEVELADGTTVVADEAYLRRSIHEPTADIVKGYAPAMPDYSSMINETEMDQLIAYLKELETR